MHLVDIYFFIGMLAKVVGIAFCVLTDVFEEFLVLLETV